MTLVASRKPRRFHLPAPTERLFEVEPGSRLLAHCHWQAEPRRHPTIVLVHGLEGSSDSSYMRGVSEKALRAGFNAVRLNQRNCGGTEGLTPTLYNSGMSDDYRAVLVELLERDALPEIFFAGFSMGGNLVLKMAGELGAAAPAGLRGMIAVGPALDLAACADALAEPQNAFYQWHFVHNLMRRFHRKTRLFPERYAADGLPRIHTLREFDEYITAPHCGYRDAVDYYYRASAVRVLSQIRVPTLVIAAQDDPFVPFASFGDPALRSNPHISLVAPANGGHCGFVSSSGGDERYWAEARTLEFCRQRSEIESGSQGSRR